MPVISCLLLMSLLPIGLPSAAFAGGNPDLLAKTPKANPGGNVYDLIALVNQVRAQNGLAPFQTNGALMAAAQAQSQYMASIGSTSHTGSGGSSIKSRALAAGYGAGADVSVVENVYGGMGATPNNAVSWWQGDGPHLATLLSTRHTDVGAGMAEGGGVVYYTLDVGSVLGGSAPPAEQPTQAVLGATPAIPGSNLPTVQAYNLVTIATPQSDGSQVHLVQAGQTLWTIAAAYQVPLSELLLINGFTENSLIFPGDKILVRVAGSADPSSPATPLLPTATPQPEKEDQAAVKPTDLPTAAPTVSLEPVQTSTAAVEPQPAPSVKNRGSREALVRLFILIFLIGGAILFGAGRLVERKG